MNNLNDTSLNDVGRNMVIALIVLIVAFFVWKSISRNTAIERLENTPPVFSDQGEKISVTEFSQCINKNVAQIDPNSWSVMGDRRVVLTGHVEQFLYKGGIFFGRNPEWLLTPTFNGTADGQSYRYNIYPKKFNIEDISGVEISINKDGADVKVPPALVNKAPSMSAMCEAIAPIVVEVLKANKWKT